MFMWALMNCSSNWANSMPLVWPSFFCMKSSMDGLSFLVIFNESALAFIRSKHKFARLEESKKSFTKYVSKKVDSV